MLFKEIIYVDYVFKNTNYKRNVLLLNVLVCGTFVTAVCALVVHTVVCITNNHN